ncbi:hypothetical protein APX70_04949, partial [Pseudomonas syringae pv. maculicola]
LCGIAKPRHSRITSGTGISVLATARPLPALMTRLRRRFVTQAYQFVGETQTSDRSREPISRIASGNSQGADS